MGYAAPRGPPKSGQRRTAHWFAAHRRFLGFEVFDAGITGGIPGETPVRRQVHVRPGRVKANDQDRFLPRSSVEYDGT